MIETANLGFPRIGAKRELKKALEDYWKGQQSEAELLHTARDLRLRHWQQQAEAGLTHIPSNDFSLYDHVLDITAMVGAIPERYGRAGGMVDMALYFAMARGSDKAVAMEMTKWFDTNYHYLVPELSADMSFRLASHKPIDEFLEAKEAGILTRPVLLGPVSYLLLAKMKDDGNRWQLLPALLGVYREVLEKLAEQGAKWVQVDEPCLVLDLDKEAENAYQQAYTALADVNINIMLASYFGALGDNTELAAGLPVAGLHIDVRRAPEQLDGVCAALPPEKYLSLGVVDGRNIWKTDFATAEELIKRAVAKRGDAHLMIAPSCSLLHVPVDLSQEEKLDKEIRNWLAFAIEKLTEIRLLAQAANGERDEAAFAENKKAIDGRNISKRIHNEQVQKRMQAITPDMMQRKSAFAQRMQQQQKNLNLPLLPTTTIGSYPQTSDVRQARAKFRAGEMTAKDYQNFLEQQTAEAMRWQDDIGLDVPVHGEFERNDMVEYFGAMLTGFCFTQKGWVQSYGSRCVKPPIIYGDVARPEPMTIKWAQFAQKQTQKPVKGMLTGPVTMMQWSFVRDDQPRAQTCRQIALAIRDEVLDLEQAGIRIIQIDEAALREGLPLRQADWQAYLQQAVEAFKLASCGVADKTQIHTHMCYSEFNDIIEAVAAMDADVISIETSRSQMELLDAFVDFKYPNDIGPGVYDIHSPRIPEQAEMGDLLEKALKVLAPEQLWVNPDCGLKTRNWEEVKPAIKAMVQAAGQIRARLEAENITRMRA